MLCQHTECTVTPSPSPPPCQPCGQCWRAWANTSRAELLLVWPHQAALHASCIHGACSLIGAADEPCSQPFLLPCHAVAKSAVQRLRNHVCVTHMDAGSSTVATTTHLQNSPQACSTRWLVTVAHAAHNPLDAPFRHHLSTCTALHHTLNPLKGTSNQQ